MQSVGSGYLLLESEHARSEAHVTELTPAASFAAASGRTIEGRSQRTRSGRKNFLAMEEAGKDHLIEKVGAELRGMMPWISAGKQSVQDAAGGQG